MRLGYYLTVLICLLSVNFGTVANASSVTVDAKKPLNAQFIYKNTTYQINDLIDLSGQTVTIPQNSVLVFNGGCLKNGILAGDNTFVQSAPALLFDNIIIKGSWRASDAYAEWFGARANTQECDSREAIQKCLDVFNSMKLVGVYYLLSSGENGICIQAKEGASIQGNQTPYPQNMGAGFVAMHKDTKKILCLSTSTTVKNLGIKGNNTGTDRKNDVVGIFTGGTSRIHISDVQISNCGTAMDCTTYLTLCERVTAYYCIKGFYFHGSSSSQYTSVSLNNCFAFSTLDYAYKMEKLIYSSLNTCAADFIGYNSANELSIEKNSYEGAYVFDKCVGISLIACGSENCVRGMSLNSCGNVDARACRFTGGYKDNVKAYLSEYIRIKNCFHSNLGISIELRELPKDFNYVSYSHYEADSHNSFDEGMKSRMLVKSTGRVNTNALMSKMKFE